MRIAEKILERQSNGAIHGDLKPANIILTELGPVPIDDFNLTEGDISPGWTYHWSAPEQILGEPVSSKTDIYPLGCMIVALLQGNFVGEVRRFKTPPLPVGQDEFDVFFNPSIWVNPEKCIFTDTSDLREWLLFAKSCLRFEKNERPSVKTFTEKLSVLLNDHKLLGEIELSISSDAVAATLIDGSDAVARLIQD